MHLCKAKAPNAARSNALELDWPIAKLSKFETLLPGPPELLPAVNQIQTISRCVQNFKPTKMYARWQHLIGGLQMVVQNVDSAASSYVPWVSTRQWCTARPPPFAVQRLHKKITVDFFGTSASPDSNLALAASFNSNKASLASKKNGAKHMGIMGIMDIYCIFPAMFGWSRWIFFKKFWRIHLT